MQFTLDTFFLQTECEAFRLQFGGLHPLMLALWSPMHHSHGLLMLFGILQASSASDAMPIPLTTLTPATFTSHRTKNQQVLCLAAFIFQSVYGNKEVVVVHKTWPALQSE